jgi:hypothetical protein
VVDAFHIRIKTEELDSTVRQDDSFAYSKPHVATAAVDCDAALQNCDEKIIGCPSRAMPSTWQIESPSEHVEIIPA